MSRRNSPIFLANLGKSSFSSTHQLWCILGLILIGCILRFLWLEDMKWKADEVWMFETARSVVTGHGAWPWLGMTNSARFLNPGASVWCFILLGFVASDPVAMVQWVAGLNVLAIGAFGSFVLLIVPQEQRLTWGWGLAIASVNPIAILYSRNIWAQNILPPLTSLILLGHWYRRYRWAAFLWGLVGILSGQVHMSGFFLQPGLTLWTVWYDRQQPPGHRTHWPAWLLGTGLGSLTLLPWVYQLLSAAGTQKTSSLWQTIAPEFYLQWLTAAWGLNLEHEFGSLFWPTFLSEPHFFGVPSYLVGVAHLFLAGCAVAALIRWVLGVRDRWQFRDKSPQFPELRFYWLATAAGMGLLMTMVGLRVPVYYLNGLFPLLQVWVAFLYRGRSRVLFAIALAQLLISIVFLVYVHQHGGIPGADYGTVYRLQNYQIKN